MKGEGSSRLEGAGPMGAQPVSKTGGPPEKGGRGSNPPPSARMPVTAYRLPHMTYNEVIFCDGYSRHYMRLDVKSDNFVCQFCKRDMVVTKQTIRMFLQEHYGTKEVGL